MKRNITYTICIFLACVFISMNAAAQQASALDYFNRASREYVKQDKLTALKTLDQGLGEYPGDPRLLKLAEELLKEEEQQQQQEKQDQQQQQDQEQQEQDEQSGEKNEGEHGDEKEKGKEQENDQQGSGEQSGSEDEQQQPRQRPGTIAPEDARRMLDALDRQEREVQDKVRAKQRPAVRTPTEKDW